MENLRATARRLLEVFKGDSYAFGAGAAERTGQMAASLGRRFLLVRGSSSERNGMLDAVCKAMDKAGLEITGECRGAAPNSPIADVLRVRDAILEVEPDAVIGLGGGSLIDALKGSVALACLGGTCDDYYGVGRVSTEMAKQGTSLMPMLAVQTASGSAAHLTKYANITDLATMQKKLFIDEALVPPVALFDYNATRTMSAEFTKVGAFDGISHLMEVYLGMPEGNEHSARVAEIALTGLELIVSSLPGALRTPESEELRSNLGLGTDLGGYAIMVGSTNGPHLNSFSLVDLMDHGKATALLLPYYVCFFAPAVRDRLLEIGRLYRKYGYIELSSKLRELEPTELGLTVAKGMAEMAASVGFLTRLDEIDGFGEEHMQRMLSAAKDPSLSSKLQGMPIPMTSEDVDAYMRPLLEAARTGDFSRIVPHRDYA